MAYALTSARNRKFLLLLWLFLYASFALIAPPLLDGADSVHAEVAREMMVRGDPVTLHVNGIRCLQPAPLLYWSMAGSMKLLGVGAAQARMPLALFLLLLFLLTERFARYAFRSVRAGAYAAMLLLLCPGLFLFTRILLPDAIVCLWMMAALYCFWRTEQQRERPGLLPAAGFGAACALNLLTAGLVGFVLPVGVVLFYLLVTRGAAGTLRRVARLHPLSAIAVSLLVDVPWQIASELAGSAEGHPASLSHAGAIFPIFWRGWHVALPSGGNLHGWACFHFPNAHLLSPLNLSIPRGYTVASLLLFWGLLLVSTMPWGAFLFQAAGAVPWRAFRSRSLAHALDAEQKALLLFAIAALLPLLCFSFSTQRALCALLPLPFLAMLIGCWLDREATEVETDTVPPKRSLAGQRLSTALLLLGALVAVASIFVLLHTKEPPPNYDLAGVLTQNPGRDVLLSEHGLDRNAFAIGAFSGPLTLAAMALFGGTLAAWWLRRNFRPHHANIALALGTAVLLVAAHKALQAAAPARSSEHLVRAIAPELRPNDLIVIHGGYESASTLGFYLQRSNLHLWHGQSPDLWNEPLSPDLSRIVETDETMRFRWNGVQRIFVWTQAGQLPTLPGKVFVVAEGGGKQIVSNKKSEY